MSQSSATPSFPDLDTPYVVSTEHIAFLRTNGFVKLKNVLSPATLAHFNQVITDKVVEMNTLKVPLEQRNTYQKAFLQVMNLWQSSEVVARFTRSRRLAQIASDLLEVQGVRLYHDQALYKEAGGGITPWHADQFYWPLASDRTITVWVPLQATTLDMGTLEFASGSQGYDLGRKLGISDDSEREIQQKVSAKNFNVVNEPYDIGEVSFHLGWTFHRAGANKSTKSRSVMTMIYMDMNMRLAAPVNQNQQNDWATWCPGAQIGAIIDTPLNPVLYDRNA